MSDRPNVTFEPGVSENERLAVIAALAAVASQGGQAAQAPPQVGRWAEPPANRRWAPRGARGWSSRR